MYLSEKRSLPFQVQDESLRQRFQQILNSDNEKILVGLPIGYYSLHNLKPEAKRTWRAIISWTYPSIRKCLPKDKLYYNASMTRLYMDYEDTSGSGVLFEKVMKIWKNREILLLEGEKSRLGTGNNLFQDAKSVQRILAPAHNAYAKFDELYNEVLNYHTDKLILVAMGPTAKPLCYELALKGYQAIDIGNLDVEYEWYLRGATTKIKIPGKYTSEAKGGRIVAEINDENYQAQIIKKIL
jgi:glycosyltransferase family protein